MDQPPHPFVRGHTVEHDPWVAAAALRELKPAELLHVLSTNHHWRHLAEGMITTGQLSDPRVSKPIELSDAQLAGLAAVGLPVLPSQFAAPENKSEPIISTTYPESNTSVGQPDHNVAPIEHTS